MKKLFIQICKLFGLELIDQNRFSSPTLNKELNQDLSIINKKSIILPLGEVKITRKVNSILIIIRMLFLNENIFVIYYLLYCNFVCWLSIVIIRIRTDKYYLKHLEVHKL